VDDGSEEQRVSWDREYSAPHPMWKGPPSADVGAEMRGRVLELGCGNGKTASALVRVADEVVALDFSRSGLEACRLLVPSPRLSLVRGDARFLPFSDGSFDHVVASHVLGHLLEVERRAAMSEIVRVLASGGTLSLRVFSVRDMRCGKGLEVERGTFRKGTGIRNHFFDADEVRSLASGLVELSLEERTSRKRYEGEERTRAEWVGRYKASTR
jgi:SAM-dependent methyltransferase